MAVDRDCLPNGVGQQGDAAGQLCRELEIAGMEPLLTLDSEGSLVGGVTLLVDAHDVSTSEAAAMQFRQQAFDILANGLPLSVSVQGLRVATVRREAFARTCDLLGNAARDASVLTSTIEIVIEAGTLSPRDASALRFERLGKGIVHVRLDCRYMRNPRTWYELWKARDTGYVRPAYASHVMSSCPLLCDEAATAVIPLTGIQVPAGTAWLAIRLDLSRFVDDRGQLFERTFEDALRRCIDIGERLHELTRWPTPQMRHDAWLNRRLAILIDGLGDLVLRRNLDPQRFTTLGEVNFLLLRIRELLVGQSRAIARKTPQLPAIDESDPSRGFPGGQVRNGWRARWLAAVESSAVRHRNILVLSPWSLFPANQLADYRFADLLPVLRFADPCSLYESPGLGSWSVDKFKAFHRRAWAVLQQRDIAHQIAERS
jgi:hypothetical protein